MARLVKHRPRRRPHRPHHPHPQPVPVPAPTPAPTPAPVPAPQPAPTAINWPSYTGAAQLAGTSPVASVSVYADPSLGSDGLTAAQDLVADADRVAAINNKIFGVSSYSPCNVIVFALGGATDGTGGADHMACDFVSGGNIECDIAIGAPARVSALFEAEYSECCMGGNLCGCSTGEALSRWCAMVVSNNALSDFASAPTWAQQGAPDYVDQVDPTDQDYVSIGCGMAFISWLLSLGHELPAIAQAMVALGQGGTLAQLYGKLAADIDGNAWPKFMAAVDALPGGLAGISSDDPFGQLAGAIAAVG